MLMAKRMRKETIEQVRGISMLRTKSETYICTGIGGAYPGIYVRELAMGILE